MFVNARAVCWLDPTGKTLTVELSNPYDARPATMRIELQAVGSQKQLEVVSDGPTSASQALVRVAAGRPTEGEAGTLARPILGYGAGGYVTLAGDQKENAELSGVVEIALATPLQTPRPIGETCTKDLDCSATPAETTFCLRQQGAALGYCTQSCSFVTDCVVSSGYVTRCPQSGYCARACAIDLDCADGLKCVLDSGPGRCEVKP